MALSRIGAVLAVCCSVTVSGQVHLYEAVRVGTSVDGAGGIQLDVDMGSNAYVAFQGQESGGSQGIYYANSFNGFAGVQRIAVEGRECSRPSLARDQTWPGRVHILMEAHAGGESDIYHVSNVGGFGVPTNLTETVDMELYPAMWTAGSNEVDMVWQVGESGAAPQLVYTAGLHGTPTTLVSDGAKPVGSLPPQTNQLHIVYLQGSDLYYLRVGGTPLKIAEGLPADSRYYVTTVGPSGAPHVVYTTIEGVWYMYRDAVGIFTEPILVAVLGSHPCLAQNPDGMLRLAYLAQGDVWLRHQEGNVFGTPTNLSQTAQVETEVKLAIDAEGFFHLLTVRDGQVWYQHSIPAPVASFTADVFVGEAPLTVTFTDTSSGPVRATIWDFGDGETGAGGTTEHVYQNPGIFDVTMTVTGPGGQDTVTQEELIVIRDPRNQLRVAEVAVWPGQESVLHPVYAMHPDGLQAFQLAIAFTDEFLTDVNVSVDDTSIDRLDPEFMAMEITDAGSGEKHLIYGLVVDVNPPFDGRTLLPSGGGERILSFLTYTVAPEAPLGTYIPFELRDGAGDPPLNNVLTQNRLSFRPRLVSGGAIVVPEPACPFLRGDPNANGAVDLADAIFILQWLFANGPDPSCQDAADPNDSGRIDIGDGINILAFLFTNGTPPAFPFPYPGADPTEDDLPFCQYP